ncbi:MAG TPA: hypothetical protein VHZ24_08080 [Pirellulales bacterium]|jgi:drug/metabolite transporter superfamily protein YnfA|nr:hypothetical protein [Pirellulales bacterium]
MSDAASPSRSWWPIVLAALVAMMASAALVFLTLGLFGVVLAIGGGVFALAALHYLVWGQWLSRIIRDEVEREENEQRKG